MAIVYNYVYVGERLTEIDGTGEEHAAAPERSRCLRKPLHRQRLDVTLAGGIASHRSDRRSRSMAFATSTVFPGVSHRTQVQRERRRVTGWP